ncbi:hypothetical protein EJB05_32444, partial [Eragrostis curvula]
MTEQPHNGSTGNDLLRNDAEKRFHSDVLGHPPPTAAATDLHLDLGSSSLFFFTRSSAVQVQRVRVASLQSILIGMELATGAMSPLLDKLGKLLVSELTLDTRVRQDVASLQREMAEMHAALRSVAAVQPDRVDEVTAAWARDVRELSYDMEDAVDAFTVRVDDPHRPDSAGGGLRSRLRGFLDRTTRLFRKGKALHQVSGAISDAQGLAQQLGELRQRYGNLHLPDGGAGATTSMSKVRSFTIFNPAIDSMPSLSQFQVLRVLDLEDCDLSKCGSHFKLKHVGNLSQLRYLGLRHTCISELPTEVGKLKFLQTLDVRGCSGIQELPPTITGLRNLISLRLEWETKLPRNGLRNLTSLEELTGLRIGDDSAAVGSELGHLSRLRVLTVKVRWKETVLGEDLVKSLGNLCKMQSLDVYYNSGRGELLRDWVPPPGLRKFFCYSMSTLPAWITSSSLPFVTYMDVWVSRVMPEDLRALGTLPALRDVRLNVMGRIDDDHHHPLSVGAGAFPCARRCVFLDFATAPSMFPRGAMPLVQRLEFSLRVWDVVGGASGFGPDDLRMEHLPSLESVYVRLLYRKEDDAEVAERVAAVVQRSAKHHPNLKSIGTRCRCV